MVDNIETDLIIYRCHTSGTIAAIFLQLSLFPFYPVFRVLYWIGKLTEGAAVVQKALNEK